MCYKWHIMSAIPYAAVEPGHPRRDLHLDRCKSVVHCNPVTLLQILHVYRYHHVKTEIQQKPHQGLSYAVHIWWWRVSSFNPIDLLFIL